MMSKNRVSPLVEKPPSVFSTGLALFSMFFGAGNLIFPLMIGHKAGSETASAVWGLGLSAVGFPLLGLIAMMLYSGKIKDFLGRLGKIPALGILFLVQVAMGPLGCMPRLITLMHASVKPYFPEFSLFSFSILTAAVVFVLTIRPQKMVDLLGALLTPILLLSMGLLIVFGLIDAPPSVPAEEGALTHFLEGLTGGYQTMDLLGGLLFATVIIPHLARGSSHLSPEAAHKSLKKRMLGASLIAGFLLMASYIGLCWLAAYHGPTLAPDLLPEETLHAIAHKILGPIGGAFASITVLLACLTTILSLASVFSEYVRTEWMKQKVGPATPLALTLAAAAALANLGFTGIVNFIGPILEILYPGLIVLCLFNIAHRLYEVQPVRSPVFLALGLAAAGFCIR